MPSGPSSLDCTASWRHWSLCHTYREGSNSHLSTDKPACSRDSVLPTLPWMRTFVSADIGIPICMPESKYILPVLCVLKISTILWYSSRKLRRQGMCPSGCSDMSHSPKQLVARKINFSLKSWFYVKHFYKVSILLHNVSIYFSIKKVKVTCQLNFLADFPNIYMKPQLYFKSPFEMTASKPLRNGFHFVTIKTILTM